MQVDGIYYIVPGRVEVYGNKRNKFKKILILKNLSIKNQLRVVDKYKHYRNVKYDILKYCKPEVQLIYL